MGTKTKINKIVRATTEEKKSITDVTGRETPTKMDDASSPETSSLCLIDKRTKDQKEELLRRRRKKEANEGEVNRRAENGKQSTASMVSS